MFERDYILRAIKEFTQGLARILDRKQNQQYGQALAQIADTAKALVGMTTEQLVLLPVDSILDICRAHGDLEIDRIGAAARLLKEHGETLELSGATGSKPYYVKAFLLYDEISKVVGPEEMADHEETMGWVMERLD